MTSSQRHIAGMALVEAYIESGIAEKIGEDCYQFKDMSQEQAIETYRDWAKANPDRAARYEEIISAAVDLAEA